MLKCKQDATMSIYDAGVVRVRWNKGVIPDIETGMLKG